MFRIVLSLHFLTLVLAQWQGPPDVSQHWNLRLLPPNCGSTRFSSRITGGGPATLMEFPWMALIVYSTPTESYFGCDGSIINDRYVLTAAHCIIGPEYPLSYVRVGEHNTQTPQDCQITILGRVCAPPYQDVRIERAIPHEYYQSGTAQNDIGLLRVARMNFAPENVRPICLPLAEARTYNLASGLATVAGWGKTEYQPSSSELLKVTLPLVPLSTCQARYLPAGHTLYSSQICAGGVDRRDSCSGDSGGPLFVKTTINGRYKFVQQGIVSFGPQDCGNSFTPGVYTKVPMFMDWILNHMQP